jgi:hypothetical protein
MNQGQWDAWLGIVNWKHHLVIIITIGTYADRKTGGGWCMASGGWKETITSRSNSGTYIISSLSVDIDGMEDGGNIGMPCLSESLAGKSPFTQSLF